jgi:hypothetical protein
VPLLSPFNIAFKSHAWGIEKDRKTSSDIKTSQKIVNKLKMKHKKNPSLPSF